MREASVKGKLLAALCALLFSFPAAAGMFSEFGGGIKGALSNVLDAGCHEVLIVNAEHSVMFDELGRQKTVPCGGRNPVFIGWPVAWESDNGNTRFGWFHMSHWIDGPPFNRRNETAFNCLCASHKFNWRGK